MPGESNPQHRGNETTTVAGDELKYRFRISMAVYCAGQNGEPVDFSWKPVSGSSRSDGPSLTTIQMSTSPLVTGGHRPGISTGSGYRIKTSLA